LSRGVAGAEAVVDVDDRHAAAAAVEHAKQGGDAAEAGAIPDAGGHGDDRFGDQPGNDAGQGAFHAGDHDQDVCALDLFVAIQQTVESRHAHVEESFDAVAHDIGGDGSLLGHRNIAGARAEDGNDARSFRQGLFRDRDATGFRVMDGVFEFPADGPRMEGSDPGDEHWLFLFGELGGDPDHLFRGLPGAEDDFRKTFSQRAVRVHGGKAELRHRRGLECAEGMLERDLSGAEQFQELSGLVGCHAAEVAMGE
jgi:hypothetical protein